MSLRKAREKQSTVESATSATQKDKLPELNSQGEAPGKLSKLSKRELARQGDYVQLAVLLPKGLVKKLKYVVVDSEDPQLADLSDHVAAALQRYLEDKAAS